MWCGGKFRAGEPIPRTTSQNIFYAFLGSIAASFPGALLDLEGVEFPKPSLGGSTGAARRSFDTPTKHNGSSRGGRRIGRARLTLNLLGHSSPTVLTASCHDSGYDLTLPHYVSDLLRTCTAPYRSKLVSVPCLCSAASQ